MYSKLSVLVVAILLVAQTASADTILKFGLGGTGPDLRYIDGNFGTIDDAIVGTVGEQDTGIDFTGFLDPLIADIASGASFTLDNVLAVGGASQLGSLVSQQTDGGTFSIWNEANELLLSAELGEGVIGGSVGVGTGSFFNTEVVNFTGGSLLAYVNATPGGISLALANILTNGQTGVVVGQNDQLQDFVADADGLVTGEQSSVPEPSTMLLLGAAGIGGLLKKRKQS